MGINTRNIYITEDKNIELIERHIASGLYQYVVWDSVNYIECEVKEEVKQVTQKQIKNLCNKYEHLGISHLYIFHAKKSGDNYIGPRTTEHDSSIVLAATIDGQIELRKNRCSEIKVKSVSIRKLGVR